MTHHDLAIEGRPLVPTEPDPILNALNRLVGTWTLSGPGGLGGIVRYEWMDGGFFLIRHLDIIQAGLRVKGVEYIGHDPTSDTLASHYFDSSGALLRYLYEIDGDTLTIWHRGVGPPARYVGTFSADGTSNSGQWEWPGGRYESTITRTS